METGLTMASRSNATALRRTLRWATVNLAHVVADVIQYSREEPGRVRKQGGSAAMSDHDIHEDHTHVHGEGCGHVAVSHGDHADYIHDGHTHCKHDGHYDERPLEHVAHSEHAHEHGEGCGHDAVPHGDHVDYVHDGHRHARHEGHYDEH
jgi:hypothetical protein